MTGARQPVIKGRQAPRALDKMLTDVLIYIEEALELDESFPRCTCCEETENLTECRAIPDGTYHLCRKHLAEERQR